MVSDPIGDSGLKVDDSRLIVQLSNDSGVGDRPPSVVIGPLDSATPEAADALLKTLEDLTEGPLKIVLWADDLLRVIPTIRSRTWAKWCPPVTGGFDPLSYLETPAEALCQAILSRDSSRILGALEEIDKGWPELLQALCAPLAKALEEGDYETTLEVWPRLRPLLDGKGSVLVAADALLPILRES